MQQLLALGVVGLGGSVGVIARYVLSGLAQTVVQEKFGRSYPVGTLLVNAIGCLLIGMLMAMVTERQLAEGTRLFLITGILGSLTTFSTFGYETVELILENDLRLAFWNVAANICIGFPAVWIGWTVFK